MADMVRACSSGCVGWLVDDGGQVVRCDTCGVFEDDDAALEHVRDLLTEAFHDTPEGLTVRERLAPDRLETWVVRPPAPPKSGAWAVLLLVGLLAQACGGTTQEHRGACDPALVVDDPCSPVRTCEQAVDAVFARALECGVRDGDAAEATAREVIDPACFGDLPAAGRGRDPLGTLAKCQEAVGELPCSAFSGGGVAGLPACANVSGR